jgi:murein DD-endopeptidase MepM/ murein hydrolase activator NlpD
MQSADVSAPLPPVQSTQPAPKPEEHPLVTAQDFAPAATSAPPAAQTIIVKPGETLFSVGRTYRVSRQAVIAANNLQPPYALKIGSRLIIPSGDASASSATASAEPAPPTAAPVPQVTTTAAPQTVASSAPVTVASSITAETAVVTAPGNKAHVVKAGETVASISRTENVRFSQLIKLNKLAKPYHLKAGQQLKLVDGAEIAVASKQQTMAPIEIHTADTRPAEAHVAEAKPDPATSHAEGGPLLHLGESPIAPASAPKAQPEQHASIAPPASKSEFIWPVSGRILSAFGPKEAGRRNDGVNIATPIGTAVRAARAGEVIYIGNELRGYGNLVLIRHDDGYVSAYAHNSRILVARGAFVQQGQEIAESGESGSVDAPQVHFEIRKDRKPIDPLDYLPKA